MAPGVAGRPTAGQLRGRRMRRRPRDGPDPRHSTRPGRSVSALRGSGGLLALRFLALALHAGLLVVLAPASLGEDAALLDLLVEAAQRTLEGLVFTHSDFCQFRVHLPGAVVRLDRIAARNPDSTPDRANRAEAAGV